MHSPPITYAWDSFLLAFLLGAFVVAGVIVAVNGWLRTRNVSGVVRAVTAVGILFFIPLVSIVGSYLFFVRASYVYLDQPATPVRVPNVPIQRNVNDHAAPAATTHGESADFHQANVQHSPEMSFGETKRVALIVFALVFVGLLIGFQVWLQQSGASLSGKSVLLAALSMIWLIPVAAVLLWVSYRAVERSVAIYEDFHQPASPAIVDLPKTVAVPNHGMNDVQHVVDSTPVATPADALKGTPSGSTTTVSDTTPVTPPQETQPRQPLPDWVTRGNFEENGSRFYVVVSQRFATEDEARGQALTNSVRMVEADVRDHFPGMPWAMLTPEIVQRFSVRRQHVETEQRQTAAGTPVEVQRAFYQVEVSPAVYTEMNKAAKAVWAASAVSTRLKGLGAVGGFLTMMFATLAGYLRLDDRTKGSYRNRLRVAAVSLIVAAGVAAAAVI